MKKDLEDILEKLVGKDETVDENENVNDNNLQ
jgi:hypothetical protein